MIACPPSAAPSSLEKSQRVMKCSSISARLLGTVMESYRHPEIHVARDVKCEIHFRAFKQTNLFMHIFNRNCCFMFFPVG